MNKSIITLEEDKNKMIFELWNGRESLTISFAFCLKSRSSRALAKPLFVHCLCHELCPLMHVKSNNCTEPDLLVKILIYQQGRAAVLISSFWESQQYRRGRLPNETGFIRYLEESSTGYMRSAQKLAKCCCKFILMTNWLSIVRYHSWAVCWEWWPYKTGWGGGWG